MTECPSIKEVIDLLREFIQERLTAEDFSHRYIILADQINNCQSAFANSRPDLKKLIDEMLKNFKPQDDEFLKRFQILSLQAHEGCPIMPFSDEDRIIWKLYSTADCFGPLRVTAPFVTEEELRQYTTEALHQLENIQDRALNQ